MPDTLIGTNQSTLNIGGFEPFQEKLQVSPKVNNCILSNTYLDTGFPCGSNFPTGKKPACYAGNLSSIPGLGISPGEGKGYLLQYSGLENSMDCIVHVVSRSWTWLSKFHPLTT